YSQLLVMPDLKEEELVNAIHLQADEFVPLPIEDVYIDLDIISKLPDNKLLILFVAAPKKIVDHLSNTISLAGLEAYTLENELSAVGRFISEVYPFIKEPSLIINFGFGGSSIYFLNPPFPYFQITRATHIGLDILLRDLSVNLNLKDKQALDAMQNVGLKPGAAENIYPIIYPIISELLTDIEKTMLLAKEKYNSVIKNIYLYNLNGQIAGLNEAIQNKLNIPTQAFPTPQIILQNPVSQSFATSMSSFISVIAADIR
ncbi:pilus assembly protein PilM, partial [Candidatus Woesebacteria bacterium]|nr:pilus assembly protein PilM [Candidatus Woesebacteria bacterium]